jgi:hypothetical protein
MLFRESAGNKRPDPFRIRPNCRPTKARIYCQLAPIEFLRPAGIFVAISFPENTYPVRKAFKLTEPA